MEKGLKLFGAAPFQSLTENTDRAHASMTDPTYKPLVPVTRNLPAVFTGKKSDQPSDRTAYELVKRETYLRDSEDVERYLPDILGRVLARVWIDPHFKDRFAADPKGTLEAYHVYLPTYIDIEFETESAPRPQVIVYERNKFGRRNKLIFLRLMMMAGR